MTGLWKRSSWAGSGLAQAGKRLHVNRLAAAAPGSMPRPSNLVNMQQGNSQERYFSSVVSCGTERTPETMEGAFQAVCAI